LNKQTLKVYSGLQSNGTSSYVAATLKNLTSYGAISSTDKFRYVADSSGKMIVSVDIRTLFITNSSNESAFIAACGTKYGVSVSDSTSTGYKYYQELFDNMTKNGYNCPDGATANTTNENSSEWLQSQIDGGNIFLYEFDSTGGSAGTGDYVNVSWTSGDASLSEVTDSTQTAKAEATYETTMANIQSKDKRFDTQLSTIDTEHTATQTEIDSVKKVMQKNIERSFKIFDA